MTKKKHPSYFVFFASQCKVFFRPVFNQGFTLIEMMMASAVMSIVSLGISATLVQITKAQMSTVDDLAYQNFLMQFGSRMHNQNACTDFVKTNFPGFQMGSVLNNVLSTSGAFTLLTGNPSSPLASQTSVRMDPSVVGPDPSRFLGSHLKMCQVQLMGSTTQYPLRSDGSLTEMMVVLKFISAKVTDPTVSPCVAAQGNQGSLLVTSSGLPLRMRFNNNNFVDCSRISLTNDYAQIASTDAAYIANTAYVVSGKKLILQNSPLTNPNYALQGSGSVSSGSDMQLSQVYPDNTSVTVDPKINARVASEKFSVQPNVVSGNFSGPSYPGTPVPQVSANYVSKNYDQLNYVYPNSGGSVQGSMSIQEAVRTCYNVSSGNTVSGDTITPFALIDVQGKLTVFECINGHLVVMAMGLPQKMTSGNPTVAINYPAQVPVSYPVTCTSFVEEKKSGNYPYCDMTDGSVSPAAPLCPAPFSPKYTGFSLPFWSPMNSCAGLTSNLSSALSYGSTMYSCSLPSSGSYFDAASTQKIGNLASNLVYYKYACSVGNTPGNTSYYAYRQYQVKYDYGLEVWNAMTGKNPAPYYPVTLVNSSSFDSATNNILINDQKAMCNPFNIGGAINNNLNGFMNKDNLGWAGYDTTGCIFDTLSPPQPNPKPIQTPVPCSCIVNSPVPASCCNGQFFVDSCGNASGCPQNLAGCFDQAGVSTNCSGDSYALGIPANFPISTPPYNICYPNTGCSSGSCNTTTSCSGTAIVPQLVYTTEISGCTPTLYGPKYTGYSQYAGYKIFCGNKTTYTNTYPPINQDMVCQQYCANMGLRKGYGFYPGGQSCPVQQMTINVP